MVKSLIEEEDDEMITSVRFNNFKSLSNYSVSLRSMNVMVGPNNAGKSTVLDSFRVLGGAYRYASRYNPSLVELPDGRTTFGYSIPESSIPIGTEHVHTNYNDKPTTISFRFDNGRNLHITFSASKQPIMYFDDGKTPKTATQFRKEFPLRLTIIPALGPLERDEEILDRDYVHRWSGSHRSPRMFRNFWFYDPKGFETFKRLVEQTWPGMSITLPERESFMSSKLNMFYLESRITREVSWSGFGFQIWLQLLTHIVKAGESDLLVVDEPEIYLHPDLQRKVITVLREMGTSVLIATHSVEIINEVDPDEVLVLDRTKKSAKRMGDLVELQTAAEVLGSAQNIYLTRLARSRRILFVEGNDAKILRLFAEIISVQELIDSGELTLIPVGGYSQWDRIIHAKWAFSKIMHENVRISALFDRDYRCPEEVHEFKTTLGTELSFVHVLKRKEIENYFLEPLAIERAIKRQLKRRTEAGTLEQVPEFNTHDLLMSVSEQFKSDVFGQLSSNKYRYMQKKGLGYDMATVTSLVLEQCESEWKSLVNRLRIIPGKDFLSELNSHLQSKWGVTLTYKTILSNMDPECLDEDLKVFFDNLKMFLE